MMKNLVKSGGNFYFNINNNFNIFKNNLNFSNISRNYVTLPSPYKKFATKAIHAGNSADPTTGAVIPPIYQTSTYKQASPGVHKGFEYSRTANPTRLCFEEAVASLENGKWGLAFGSGMAATTTLTHLLQPKEELVAIDDMYGGTFRYFSKIAGPRGLAYHIVDFTDGDNYLDHINPNTKMVWLETPTNPTLKIVDIAVTTAKIKQKNPNTIVVVDNTFLSPYFQRPLDLGADVVIHSVTKYLNGHCDVVMGVVVGKNDKIGDQLRFLQNGIGAVPGPMDCFLASRGLKTLHLRMERSEENAQKIVAVLEKHEKVAKVSYPGLASHPQHHIAKKQMSGFGAMITFWLKGNLVDTRHFLENLQVFTLAESLGGVESLANHPALMTHASVPPETRQKLGITDNMVRLSIGIEDSDDLIEDLNRALDKVKNQ